MRTARQGWSTKILITLTRSSTWTRVILLAGLALTCHAVDCLAAPPARLFEASPPGSGIRFIGNEFSVFDDEYGSFIEKLRRTRLPDAADIVLTHSPNADTLGGYLYDATGNQLVDADGERIRMGKMSRSDFRKKITKSLRVPTPTRPLVILGCNGAVGCAFAFSESTGLPAFGTSGRVTPVVPPAGGVLFLGRALEEQFGPQSIMFRSEEAIKVYETGAVGGKGGWARDLITPRALRLLLDHATPEDLLPIHPDSDGTWYPKDPTLCFVAGTPVATERGPRPIERIRPGDFVWAFDAATGEKRLKRVTQAIAQPPGAIYEVDVRIGRTIETLRTTAEHPFFVRGEGWVAASRLTKGTGLVTRSGAEAAVFDTRATSDVEPVFNLEVEDFHSYYAGSAEVVVHNGPCGDRARATMNLAQSRLRGIGRVFFEPSLGGSLGAMSFALHAWQDGLVPTAAGAALIGSAFAAGTKLIVWSIARVGLKGAASWTSRRLIPVVGQVLLVADIAKTLVSLGLDYHDWGWGDVASYYKNRLMGTLDQPTYLAGPPPPADQNLYFD